MAANRYISARQRSGERSPLCGIIFGIVGQEVTGPGGSRCQRRGIRSVRNRRRPGLSPPRPLFPVDSLKKTKVPSAASRRRSSNWPIAAVTKNSYDSFFSGFLSDLAKRDKERAREFKGADQNHLNDLITQIQTAWHAKYNQDFDVSDKNVTFDERFAIAQGEVSDPTQAISAWPVAAAAGQAVTANSSNEQQDSNSHWLTKGRAVAIMRFPESHGLAAMNVLFIHQPTGWYIDIPVDRTGQQVYNDLSADLSFIASHQDQWPTDVNDAYRMVTHQVLAALYGVTGPASSASAITIVCLPFHPSRPHAVEGWSPPPVPQQAAAFLSRFFIRDAR